MEVRTTLEVAEIVVEAVDVRSYWWRQWQCIHSDGGSGSAFIVVGQWQCIQHPQSSPKARMGTPTATHSVAEADLPRPQDDRREALAHRSLWVGCPQVCQKALHRRPRALPVAHRQGTPTLSSRGMGCQGA